MRSNIARTCCSGSVPAWTPSTEATLLQLGEEADEGVELLGRQALERRHRRRRVAQRRGDGLRRELVGHVGQGRPGAVVAVLADLVAGQAARLPDDELAGLEDLAFLGRRPG